MRRTVLGVGLPRLGWQGATPFDRARWQPIQNRPGWPVKPYGGKAEDGAGEGIAADVALLAQRYADLRRLVEYAIRSADWEPGDCQRALWELRDGYVDLRRNKLATP